MAGRCSTTSVVNDFCCERAEVETLHITSGGSLEVLNAVDDETYRSLRRVQESGDASRWSAALDGVVVPELFVEEVEEIGPRTTMVQACSKRLEAGEHTLAVTGPGGVRGVFVLLPPHFENSEGALAFASEDLGFGRMLSGWSVAGILTAGGGGAVPRRLALTLLRAESDGWGSEGAEWVTVREARGGSLRLLLDEALLPPGSSRAFALARRLQAPRPVRLASASSSDATLSVSLAVGATQTEAALSFLVHRSGQSESESAELELELELA